MVVPHSGESRALDSPNYISVYGLRVVVVNEDAYDRVEYTRGNFRLVTKFRPQTVVGGPNTCSTLVQHP